MENLGMLKRKIMKLIMNVAITNLSILIKKYLYVHIYRKL